MAVHSSYTPLSVSVYTLVSLCCQASQPESLNASYALTRSVMVRSRSPAAACAAGGGITALHDTRLASAAAATSASRRLLLVVVSVATLGCCWCWSLLHAATRLDLLLLVVVVLLEKHLQQKQQKRHRILALSAGVASGEINLRLAGEEVSSKGAPEPAASPEGSA